MCTNDEHMNNMQTDNSFGHSGKLDINIYTLRIGVCSSVAGVGVCFKRVLG